ncbi:hypothetical protein [Sorangium sp. So ce513]|uniref:hypothetical protein n=1 Tax=Sorangium sp. So ce513 TaxID=3133315 RepID=UPI003F5E8417
MMMKGPGRGPVERATPAGTTARRLRGMALSCTACLALALAACAPPAPRATGPAPAPRATGPAPAPRATGPAPAPRATGPAPAPPAARPATRGAPPEPPADDAVDLVRQALALFFAAPSPSTKGSTAAGDQDTWLTPRVRVERLPEECWALTPERDEGGLAIVALRRRSHGAVACVPFPTRPAPLVATFAVDRRAGKVLWWDRATPRPMRAFFDARAGSLRAAVATLEKRLLDDAIDWGGAVKLRVEGEAATHLDVSVLSSDGGRRLARFRVDRKTHELSWDDEGEPRAYEAFKARWYRDHPPAVTALAEILAWRWSGVDALTLEASHGHVFDLIARADETCSRESALCSTERFRVDMRRGAVMWHDGKAHVPIERFLQDLDQKAKRAILLARAFALRSRGRGTSTDASCLAFMTQGVDRASAHVRMHIGPPCNTSPLPMTLGWYFVDLRSGKVCSLDDERCAPPAGQQSP